MKTSILNQAIKKMTRTYIESKTNLYTEGTIELMKPSLHGGDPPKNMCFLLRAPPKANMTSILFLPVLFPDSFGFLLQVGLMHVEIICIRIIFLLSRLHDGFGKLTVFGLMVDIVINKTSYVPKKLRKGLKYLVGLIYASCAINPTVSRIMPETIT